MNDKSRPHAKLGKLALAIFAGVSSIAAQVPKTAASAPVDNSLLGPTGMLLGVIVLAAIGVGAIVFLRKKQSAGESALKLSDNAGANGLKRGEIRMTYTEKKKATAAPVETPAPKVRETVMKPKPAAAPDLPVYSFIGLQKAPRYTVPGDSLHDTLLQAIEQTNENSDEDADTRSGALRVLAAYKNGNAITAISQTALYDLSSKLRSSAVSILADMDTEAVFETIVAACADPTREVRAAAARGLFRLSFDRAQAWTRIIDSNDLGRMRQAARAAIEGDLVERSFERLVHKDRKTAYEAYVLTVLLIKTDETEPIYRTLAEHKDENIKLALLHVLQNVENENTFQSLSELLIRHALTPNVTAKVNEVRSCCQLLAV